MADPVDTSDSEPPEDEFDLITDAPFDAALSERYLVYALSTITARSLPDLRDGLKPMHRLQAIAQIRQRTRGDRRKRVDQITFRQRRIKGRVSDQVKFVLGRFGIRCVNGISHLSRLATLPARWESGFHREKPSGLRRIAPGFVGTRAFRTCKALRLRSVGVNAFVDPARAVAGFKFQLLLHLQHLTAQAWLQIAA